MKNYNFKEIESKWQDKWNQEGLYRVSDTTEKPKFYILDMFPYPSGAGLHVGHPKGYIATDVFARMKMMQGYNVLHPMGWDAFGLPAENYAIKNKVHPRLSTEENIATFKSQLFKFGFNYDWDREINTTDPEYYKWTQWCFLKMLEKGLAFESFEPINWCPGCQTGLANEDLEDGKCERCGSEIEQKPMRQWVLKITDYADRLLEDLDKLPEWDDSIKEMQRNWIGRSEGAVVKFDLKSESNLSSHIEVFTTRVDTIFGCTYVVVAPEHKLISEIKDKAQNISEIENYIEASKKKTELERTELQKEKTGVEIKGIKAVNPFNGEEVPVFVADYVLGHYGTGAVMAVPAHDERDFEFAKKYDLPIVQSISPFEGELNVEGVFTEDGVLIGSGEFSGLKSEEARAKMIEWLEKNGLGEKKVNYKLKDWVFSRQRYWGEPIPVIHCEECGVVPVPEKDLPVTLPEVEHYEPSGTGESPLATIEEWVNTACPKCGGKAKRETNTMPQWAGSSWYYLRYIDPKNNDALVDKDKEKYWSPVDFYVGGAEHATRHLIYARFWHKFLFDIGAVSYSEPFVRLQHVGLIMAEDGRKMSKRWGNVVNPDDVIEIYGADAVRLYEMFMGPFSQSCNWSTRGVVGTKKFLDRVWRIFEEKELIECAGDCKNAPQGVPTLLHKTIKKVSEDIENFDFNTAISQMMIFVNEVTPHKKLPKNGMAKFVQLLAPFAPHIAEEIWREKLGKEKSIFLSEWPSYNPRLLQEERIEMVVQVNGKVRDKISVDTNIDEDGAKKIALESDKVRGYVEESEIKKVIFVKGKLISFVV